MRKSTRGNSRGTEIADHLANGEPPPFSSSRLAEERDSREFSSRPALHCVALLAMRLYGSVTLARTYGVRITNGCDDAVALVDKRHVVRHTQEERPLR